MSKKFKNQICAYCAVPNLSETADHVFAREFLITSERNDLPKVPACKKCNNDKSKLEHYLSAVIPFGAQRKNDESIWQKVKSRLDKNIKLFRAISAGIEYKIIPGDGFDFPRMIIPFDGEKYIQLFEFITKGLLVYHWNLHLTGENDLIVITATKEGEAIFDQIHSGNANQRVRGNIGNETFLYEVAQAKDNPNITICKFIVLGGVQLSEGGENITSVTYAITGPQDLIKNLREVLL